MRTACCLAILLMSSTCLAAERRRAVIGTVIAYEAPSGDKPGKMVVRHTYRLDGKLVNDDYHFVFANHLLKGEYDPAGVRGFAKARVVFKVQYPHMPKDVRVGASIDVFTDREPARGKVYVARDLLIDYQAYWKKVREEDRAKAKKP